MGHRFFSLRRLRLGTAVLIILLGIWAAFGPVALAAQDDKDNGESTAVIIPIKGQIDPGLAGFVQRSLDKAYRSGASRVILDIDTPGGLIASAEAIKDSIFASKVPTAAFISGQAKSAGVLISLAAEKIYMTPGASIGAAEPIPNNPKILASWRSDLEAAADARGRSAQIAAGMADQNLVINNIKKQGEILSLSAKKAIELGFADRIIENRDALLTYLAQQDGVYYQVAELTPGFGEKLAWWLINPFVSPVLLMIGFAGLIVEVFVPGFGVPGGLGLLALGLYFGGHMMTGVTGWLAVFVFVLGLAAIILEVTVIPGGVVGIAGMALVIWSVFLASTSSTQAVVSLTAALGGSVFVTYILVKVMGHRGMWNKLILGLNLDTARGYTAPKQGLDKFLGQEGTTITPLRPAGTAEFAGERVDVVTEGGFAARGTAVKVVLVEGGRVVVRPIGDTRL